MLIELKNPDWTKTPEERDAYRGSHSIEGWRRWWNIEHQYPYQSGLKPVRRKWLNPFYCPFFYRIFVPAKERGKQK